MLEHHDDLFAEFPDQKERISHLIGADPHFARMVRDYAMLDGKVFDLESKGTPVADRMIEDLKKQRLALKDQIFKAL